MLRPQSFYVIVLAIAVLLNFEVQPQKLLGGNFRSLGFFKNNSKTKPHTATLFLSHSFLADS